MDNDIDDMGIGIRVFGSGGMGGMRLLKRVLNKSFMTCPDDSVPKSSDERKIKNH